MRQKIKKLPGQGAASSENAQRLNTSDNSIKPVSPPKKSEAVLDAFVEHKNLNTFQAQAIYGDSCLHTSISSLKRNHGIIFRHEWESVTNRIGRKVRVVRYHLIDQNKAMTVLKILQKQRGFYQEVV